MSKITWKPGTMLAPVPRNGRKTECNDCSLDRHYQQRTADDLRVNQAVTFFARPD